MYGAEEEKVEKKICDKMECALMCLSTASGQLVGVVAVVFEDMERRVTNAHDYATANRISSYKK